MSVFRRVAVHDGTWSDLVLDDVISQSWVAFILSQTYASLKAVSHVATSFMGLVAEKF